MGTGLPFQRWPALPCFCATVGERWRRNFERLRAPADLARWVTAADLVVDQPTVSTAELQHARELREAIYRLVRSAIAGRPGAIADREIVNAWARRTDLAPQIGPAGKRSTSARARSSRACLATVARDAVELLTGPEINRVRECSAPDCALLFVDLSRPGSGTVTTCGWS